MSRRRKKLTSGEGWSLVPAGSESESTPEPEAGSGEPRARISLEKRRGKPVTVIQFEGLEAERIRDLGRDLRTRMAAGGKTGASGVEIQGDHRERVRELLKEQGLEVR